VSATLRSSILITLTHASSPPAARNAPSALNASARTGRLNRVTLDSNAHLPSSRLAKSLTQASSEPVAKVLPSGATATTFTMSSCSSVKLSSTSPEEGWRTYTALSAPQVTRRASSPEPM
jgi:hypothetical protein